MNAKPEVVYKRLQEIDPVMASKWHWNDTRRVRRSLQVIYYILMIIPYTSYTSYYRFLNLIYIFRYTWKQGNYIVNGLKNKIFQKKKHH